MNPIRPAHPRRRGRLPVALAAAAGVLALIGVAYFARQDDARVTPAPTPTVVAAAPAPVAELSAPEGWVDEPKSESIVGTKLTLAGWALAKDGVARVEVRVDDRVYPARYGLLREDVASRKPGFPDNPNGGFAFEGDFADLAPMRHDVVVVAIAKNGRESVIARRSLVPPDAMTQWKALLDERPALAKQPFYFLMMTSGVATGGAHEIESQYVDYGSRTQKIGMSVPILYMRTTRGKDRDWVFDADFDIKGPKCANRVVAEDALTGVIRFAIEKRLPVQFILNGGIWSDASCETAEWDLVDRLEQDKANVQWTQSNEAFPDQHLKNLAGSTESPDLARTLTYNVYAKTVRAYKKRNLQAATTAVSRFAREHPDLFVGVVLDADTYMNPFYYMKEVFDYNPGMLRQFREWLRGSGPYAGAPRDGAPDLSAYRRKRPLTLGDVNRIAGASWKSWDEVDPPRRLPGSPRDPEVRVGEQRIWDNPWWHEWDTFRKHIVDLHYDELSRWVSEAGVSTDRIFSAQGFLAPDTGLRPFALYVESRGQDYDSAGVSLQGAIPSHGHLGGVIYGEAARNQTIMEGPWSLFATFARMDEGWGMVETNSTDLKRAKEKPPYEWTYRSFREIYNYSAREISIMAWNGSNGLFENDPAYLPYTAWRNTPNEDAMRDFLVSHADLPFGAKLWTFGTARLASDDGWTTSRGKLSAGRSHIAVAPDRGVVELVSPPDQVIRPERIDLAVVRAWSGPRPRSVAVHARVSADAAWSEIGRSDGQERIPLRWPADWRRAIVVQVKLELTYTPDVATARIDRLLLYPRADAFRTGLRGSRS